MENNSETNSSKRLKMLIERLFLNQKRFSKKVGISEHYLSQMIDSRRRVSFDKAVQIKKKFPKLNVDWLLRGEGEMFLEDDKQGEVSEFEEQYNPHPYEKDKMTVDATEILRRLDFLNAEVWRLRERVAMLENEKKSEAKEIRPKRGIASLEK